MADLQQDADTKKSVELEKPTWRLEREAKFVFNKCCFCIPLRTGCLILAYLNLIGTTVVGIFSLLGTYSAAVYVERYSEYGIHSILITALVLNVVTLILVLIALPFNVLLVYGLHKERRSFVKFYLKFQLVLTILNLLSNIIPMAMGFITALNIVITLVTLALNIYYLLVMRSQYEMMGEAASELPAQLYKVNRDKQ